MFHVRTGQSSFKLSVVGQMFSGRHNLQKYIELGAQADVVLYLVSQVLVLVGALLLVDDYLAGRRLDHPS